MDAVNNSLIKGTMLISNQFGIVNHVSKLPRLNYDPKLVSFGIWPSNTLAFGAEKYEGRSSGCNFTRVRDKKRLEKVGNLVKNSYLYR